MTTINQMPLENSTDDFKPTSISPTAKRVWQTPRLITLDLEETEAGFSTSMPVEGSFYKPS